MKRRHPEKRANQARDAATAPDHGADPPAAIEAELAAATQHLRAGRLEEARSLFGIILEAQPDHPVALHLLGIVMQRTGKSGRAAELIGKAIALKPDDAEAHNSLGNVLAARGRFDEAIASYRTAVALDPNCAEAQGNFGTVLLRQGKFEEAVACHQNAIALDSGVPEVHNNLGFALQRQGRPEEAIASFRKAIALNASYAEAHNNLGIVLTTLGKLEEASVSYRNAIALKPDYAEAHNNLGHALKAQGRLDKAIASYRRAVALRPDYAEAHGNLGDALAARDRLEEAVVRYRKAIALKPNMAEVRDQLAKALYLGGQFKESWVEFDGKSESHGALGCKAAGSIPRPNLFIIGAMKSGTGSLHYYLNSHPSIFMCPFKEPHFFIEDNESPTGEMNYLRLFAAAGDASFIGESSTHYTKLPAFTGVARRVADFDPDARLIYIMRDPIERTISHYWHKVRYHGETQDIVDAVRENPRYRNVSHYAMQLAPYLELFGADQIKTLTLEELRAGPLKAVRDIYEWLGVDPSFVPPNLHKRWTVTPTLVQQIPANPLFDRYRKWIEERARVPIGPMVPNPPGSVARRTSTKTVDRRSVSVAGVVDLLRPIQQTETRELSRMLGRDFHEWTTLHGNG